jgi:hypothetical protein
MRQMIGLFPQLVLDVPVADSIAPITLNTHQMQQVLRLCQELMEAQANDELHKTTARTAYEQLSVLVSQLRADKVRLTGNACRDLTCGRPSPGSKVRLSEEGRTKARNTFIKLLEHTLEDLTLPRSTGTSNGLLS